MSARQIGRVAALTAALVGATALAGCGPVYTKRYAAISTPSPTPVKLELSAFTVAKEKSSDKPRLIADLPDKAQAAAIEAASQGGALTPRQIAELLSQKIEPAKQAVTAVDATSYPIRLAVVVDYPDSGVARAADRLAKLTTTFKLVNANGEEHGASPSFIGWSKLVTDKVEVDLGDVTFKQTASSNLAVSPVPEQVSLGSEFGNEVTEVLRLREQVLPLYGVLTDNTAKLVQTGSLGRDLIGVQSIDITVGFEDAQNVESRRLATSFTAPDTDKPGSLSFAEVTYPTNCADVFAEVTTTGQLRHVISGESTVIESDDRIIFQDMKSDPVKVKLIESEQLRRTIWTFKLGNLSAFSVSLPEQETPIPLEFANAAAAAQFNKWIKAQRTPPSTIGGFKIHYNNRSGGLTGRPANWARFLEDMKPDAKVINSANAGPGSTQPAEPGTVWNDCALP